MRKLIIIITLTLLHFSLVAQIEIPIDTITHSINFSIIHESSNGLSKFLIDYDKNNLPKEVLQFNLKISDADLILNTSLVRLKGKKNYNPTFIVLPKNRPALTTNSNNIEYKKRRLKKKNIENIIIWKNITEGKVFPDQSYTLNYYVVRNKILGIDCEHPPAFKLKQKWPYLTSIGIGSGLIISSRIVRNNAFIDKNKAEIAKTNYLNQWKNGNTVIEANQTYSENQSAFDNAKNKNNKQVNQFSWGAASILAGIIGYYAHWKIYKNNKALFEENKDQCSKEYTSIELKPIINFEDEYKNNQQLGLNLTYTF